MTNQYSTDWALSQGYVHVPVSPEHSLMMSEGMTRAAAAQSNGPANITRKRTCLPCRPR